MKAAIFILGPSALPIATRLRELVHGEVHGPASMTEVDRPYQDAVHHLATVFQQGQTIIALCATGIVVRALGPHLHDKHSEPPVVIVSEDGRSIVPLLGGHHGANDLARTLSAHLQGHAAITTASDLKLGIALDQPPPGYALGNVDAVKSATAKLLAGEDMFVFGEADWLSQFNSAAGTVPVAVTTKPAVEGQLTYHPKTLVVGVGCERGTGNEELVELVSSTLEAHGLAPQSVAHFASIDLKEDEAAINHLGPVRYFTTKELNAESHRVLRPSEIVRAEVGTPSVAEAAALAAAGPESKLIVPKTKSKRATCAVAEAPAPITAPRGRSRGILHVVGLGPGSPMMRSPEATIKLSRSTDWVGYDLYIDLAMDAYSGQMLFKAPLGAEEQRVRHALSLAKQGKRVALICSGDAGIYAMAALVYEVLSLEPAKVVVDVVPGISAFQAAAARAGAIIGHDFCCISLSDLLTPWETIDRRIKAAAYGDFVTAFYNPRSAKRQDHLLRALEIFRLYRPADTPVVIASNLSRQDERVRVVRLVDVNVAEIDMLTVLIVGSSQSKAFRRGDGRTFAFTPRGYEKKRLQ